VSLKLQPGELAVVEGPQASGKTTLLLLAAGILRPDSGRVTWPALSSGSGRTVEGALYVPNRPPPYGFLTVREALGYAATIREMQVPGGAPEAGSLMELAELARLSDVRLCVLAPPERARLLLAVAMVQAPRLLLIDDVNTGTSAGGAAFVRCLRSVASTGTSVLLASRRSEDYQCSGAYYLLEEGRLRRARRRGGQSQTPRGRSAVPQGVARGSPLQDPVPADAVVGGIFPTCRNSAYTTP